MGFSVGTLRPEPEKWFGYPQSLLFLFYATCSSFFWAWHFIQNLHFIRGGFMVLCPWLEPLFRGTGVFPSGFPVFCCEFLVFHSGWRVVCLALISLLVSSVNGLVVNSLALQILMHFSRVNFGSAGSFFLVLLSERQNNSIVVGCLSTCQNDMSSPKNTRR